MAERNWTTADIPDQTGRTAVVTGGNVGLGFEVARALGARGAQVVIASRDTGKGAGAAAKIAPKPDVVRLDLTSLASIREAAAELRSRYAKLDLLINNAGVMMTPYARTENGFELQLGTNHLGHFALTGLLIDQMMDVPGARIVTVSSMLHQRGSINFDDLAYEQRYNRSAAYARSKLANLLFAYELERRLERAGRQDPISLAAHPGYANTELGRYLPAPMRLGVGLVNPLFAQSPAMGALPLLRAATDPAVRGGQFYGPSSRTQMRGHPKLTASSARSHDEELASRLWTESERLTGVRYPL
ncbi:MAG: SDR family NAD(P)-dependent oxidoreductase [Streptosporangiaceae bacterium]|nr:SDR family NAD(P)-dependent oxidoreductase [Streptosporangiaceae bacterium]